MPSAFREFLTSIFMLPELLWANDEQRPPLRYLPVLRTLFPVFRSIRDCLIEHQNELHLRFQPLYRKNKTGTNVARLLYYSHVYIG